MIAAGVLMPFLGSIAYDYFGGQSAKGAGNHGFILHSGWSLVGCWHLQDRPIGCGQCSIVTGDEVHHLDRCLLVSCDCVPVQCDFMLVRNRVWP